MKNFKLPGLLMLLLTCSFLGQSQPFSIKGRVTDTLNAAELHYASVTLVRAADSVLETFTRTKEDGTFTLTTNREGKYIFTVSFPSFADYVDEITVDKAHPSLDLGPIAMVSKSHLLSEFVLRQQVGAIKIKGDTVEYVADSFKVRDGATVEELLKKLPGIQVNKNGEVVAQGEKVEKILVDGEEFFTDDPAVVTKSLQAKAVDKVQVFDKKTDQAVFSGIDDGTREKTINLQLKDNMKKGVFGKVVAGGGTDGYFENQGMINAFKGKRKVSAFGIMANTGKMGLNWQEREKYGAGDNNTEMTEDGMMFSYYTGDDDNESWRGTYNGEGLPAAWTGGLHYSNKWNNDNLHLSGNYRYAKQNIETSGNTLTQYNQPGEGPFSQYYNKEEKTSFSTGQRNKVDGMFEWKIDTSANIKLTANAGYSNTVTATNFHSRSFFFPGDDTTQVDLNENSRLSTSDATSQNVNATLAYRKRFAKKGRTLSVTFDEKYKETFSTGALNSTTQKYATDTATGIPIFDTLGQPIKTTTFINQKKENSARNLQFSGNLSYTEPLSKILFLELNYTLSLNNSYAKRLSLNPGHENDSDYIDPLYSSDYDFNVLTNRGGSNLRFVFKKVNFSFGGSVSATDFKQVNNFRDIKYTRHYTNFFPKASFIYRPGGQTSVSINYNGSTRQPTIDQIQPLQQNTDPLNQPIGNENLKQEFDHNINFRYNDYKVISGTYTYLGGGVTFADDDISRSETVDSGVRIYQYVNVDGNYNGWAYGGYGWNIRKLDMRIGVNGNVNVGRTFSYVNGQKNESINNTYSLGINANYDKEKKFNIEYGPRVSFNNNTSSVNGTNTNYWSFNNELSASFQLPWKLEIGTDVDWSVREKVAAFDNNNSRFIWNAYVAKKFLKGDQLELRASAFDILNQNSGYNRYAYDGTVTEKRYNSIMRYGLLSLTWNFTHAAAGVPQEDNAAQIIISK